MMPTLRQQIQDLIKATAQPLDDRNLMRFRDVAGAANQKAILQGRVSAPGCYIYRLRTNVGNNLLDDAVAQIITEQYGIVIVTRNAKDVRHGDSSDTNELYCDAISDILLGTQLDQYYSSFEYGGGQIVNLQDNYMYWQEIYTTGYQRRA